LIAAPPRCLLDAAANSHHAANSLYCAASITPSLFFAACHAITALLPALFDIAAAILMPCAAAIIYVFH